MIFRPLAVEGAYAIDLEPRSDERGFFARQWCADEMARHGLVGEIAQCSISHNRRRGTLRGMHYQAAPAEETKVVSCTRGRIYDVVLDLRRGSPTYLRWAAVELSASNRTMMYLPAGCAHGFQTLEDDCDVFYQITPSYDPALTRGARWDDPAFGIEWPLPDAVVMSERDRAFPAFTDA